MLSLLLAIIYLAFMSLGLPDSLLSSGWPAMHIDLNAPLSGMGIITMIIASGTIISSLFSDKLTAKFKTSIVTLVSVILTCVGLFGFSISTKFYHLCLFAIPYGLGAGAIDSALNNYVALHYSSRHMSWLHCFWGIGTIISPYVMSFALTKHSSWNLGYRIVAFIQIGIAVILLLSLPLWKKVSKTSNTEEEVELLSFKEKFKIKNIYFVLFGFFAYCALEATMMMWSSTYMVEVKGITPENAAALGAYIFIGITVGRFICGFVSNKLGDMLLIRIGQGFVVVGLLLIALSFSSDVIAEIGFLIVGFGCAPIYPCIIHATPNNFSKKNSQAIIGLQMASAYVGTTLIPPLFGLIAQYVSCALLPYYGLIFLLLNIIMIELLNSGVKKNNMKMNNE